MPPTATMTLTHRLRRYPVGSLLEDRFHATQRISHIVGLIKCSCLNEGLSSIWNSVGRPMLGKISGEYGSNSTNTRCESNGLHELLKCFF
ncbi:unnamed protein product [Ilex paraguariensis]|uniref:Uncharacterized protein n=1 Tax=Ilex paraguariensis TaxID=185542 RepID=A0ABC8QTV4_9AQUA